MRSGGGGGGSSGTQATTNDIVLGRSDLQALKGLSDIALIDTNIRGSVEVSYLGKKGKVSVTGVDQSVWSQITTSKIKTGRMLDSADQNVIVIGGNTMNSMNTFLLAIAAVSLIVGSIGDSKYHVHFRS